MSMLQLLMRVGIYPLLHCNFQRLHIKLRSACSGNQRSPKLSSMCPDEGVLKNPACGLELTCRSSHAMRASPKHSSKWVLTGGSGGLPGYSVSHKPSPHYHMNESHHVTITAHTSHWAKYKDTGLCGHCSLMGRCFSFRPS